MDISKILKLDQWGYTSLNTLAELLSGAPELAEKATAANTDLGVLAPILAGYARAGVGMIFDIASGTSGTDLPLSQRLGSTYVAAMRKRDRNRSSRELKKDYELAKYNTALAAEMAADDIKAVVAGIYGPGAADVESQAWGWQALAGINSYARRQAFDAGIGGITDAIAEGAVVHGFAKNPTDEATKNRNRWFLRSIGDEVSKAIYGYSRVVTDENGNETIESVGSITKSLSNEDVRTAITAFANRGGFSGSNRDENVAAMKDYLQKIATGVDNIKQVMGDKTTMDQAMTLVTKLTGTAAAASDADTMQNITARFRDIGYATGLNDKIWELGTAAARAQLEPYGIPQALAAGIGMDLGGLFAMSRSRNIGVGDKEHMQILADIATRRMKDGSVMQVATALQAAKLLGADSAKMAELEDKLIASGGGRDEAIKLISEYTGASADVAGQIYDRQYGTENVMRAMADGRLANKFTVSDAKTTLKNINSELDDRAKKLLGSNGAQKLKTILGGRNWTDLSAGEIERLVDTYNRTVDPNNRIDMSKLTELTTSYRVLEHQLPQGFGTVQALRDYERQAELVAKGTPRAVRGRKGVDGVIQGLNEDHKWMAAERQLMLEEGVKLVRSEAYAKTEGDDAAKKAAADAAEEKYRGSKETDARLRVGQLISKFLTGEHGYFRDDETLKKIYTIWNDQRLDREVKDDKKAQERINKAGEKARAEARSAGKSEAEVEAAGKRAEAEAGEVERIALVGKKVTEQGIFKSETLAGGEKSSAAAEVLTAAVADFKAAVDTFKSMKVQATVSEDSARLIAGTIGTYLTRSGVVALRTPITNTKTG